MALHAAATTATAQQASAPTAALTTDSMGLPCRLRVLVGLQTGSDNWWLEGAVTVIRPAVVIGVVIAAVVLRDRTRR